MLKRATLLQRIAAFLTTQSDVVLLTLLIIIFVSIVGWLTPAWFTPATLQTTASQNAPLAIVAVAMTFSIISGNIDLSPGAMIALTGVIVGLVFQQTHSLALGFFLGFLLSLGVSQVHSLLVGGLKVNAIIVTLAAYVWARGMAIGLTGANPININDSFVNAMNTLSFVGITIPIAMIAAAFLLGWYVLNRTRMGRYTFALGRDPLATARAGISVLRQDMLIFGFMGCMIAVATVITISQVAGAQPLEQQGLELDAIIAVIVGGSRLTGGEGSILKTLVGVIFIASLNSGLTNIGLNDAGYSFVKGLAILFALTLQVIVRRLIARRMSRPRTRVSQSTAAPAMSA